MTFDEIVTKYTMSKSSADIEIAKIPRRQSLYKGEGKIKNKKTGVEVQAECHQNITFELIESQISNTVPEPIVTPLMAEDAQRALQATYYLSQAMKMQDGIAINDKAERGVLKNGYGWYLIEWDQSKASNSGFGGLKLTYYPAGSVYVQPGITDFKDAEYVFLKNIATCASIKRLYGVDIPPDGDGVDDQTDVLDNALAYVDTRPKYKSRYYQTGYPDDGYGVCTDVVAFALKNAGYDLQALVDADIREHPQWYDIQQPDANIDFRRVRNLKVFFSHTAVALTTEVSETEEWQGGDLVIFEKHIGIVSDRRNKNGVPYIIHHNDPWQAAYEQDILEKRTDIVGHYRISE